MNLQPATGITLYRRTKRSRIVRIRNAYLSIPDDAENNIDVLEVIKSKTKPIRHKYLNICNEFVSSV